MSKYENNDDGLMASIDSHRMFLSQLFPVHLSRILEQTKMRKGKVSSALNALTCNLFTFTRKNF